VIQVDSIERMRRINDLTRELKQHGFADSSFEAIQQANQIYGDDDLDEHVKQGLIKNSQNDKMSERIAEENNAVKDEAKDETMGDDSISYNDRKFAKITESVQVLTDKMNEIIRALNDLDSRITEVKIRQDKLAVARQESRIEPKVEIKEPTVNEAPASKDIVQEAKPESHAQSNAQSKDEYSVNQRTGNFQSQDVAIDKMFYFGNKK
jgi:hypothetical protein